MAYIDRAAVSLIKCRGTGVNTEDVSIFIQVLKPGRTDQDALRRLIVAYTAGYKKQQPCRPGS
ncbi:hypothetical protein SSTG_03750 [Streptomyces sp. e14]|uniref:hypothetical protein n=1 Tax=Streptomyces sp. e14 TaxID=645465 RepID=UPI0001D06527|nr:hypothetical protein [Streptomyces sp. e14]EFF93431.1 hypothetical protein SSTG_03750 [Streptomyces sp. e14]